MDSVKSAMKGSEVRPKKGGRIATSPATKHGGVDLSRQPPRLTRQLPRSRPQRIVFSFISYNSPHTHTKMADTQEALETVRTFVEGAPPGEVCL